MELNRATAIHLARPSRSSNVVRVFRLCFLAVLLLVGAARPTLHAQGLISSAQISGSMGPADVYNYMLTLNNSSASTANIQTFWFAWQAGQADFMASSPSSIQTPLGWTYSVDGGGSGDGYSIKFGTSTAPLAPGHSIIFYFASPDSPAVMGGPSPTYPQFPVLSSDVYSGHTAGIRDDIIGQVVPASVPEPNVWVLLGLGLIGVAWVSRQDRPARNRSLSTR